MQLHAILISLGVVFLFGLAADVIGRKTRLPRVTLLLAIGVIVGPAGLDLIPAEASAWFDFLSVSALSMVAFVLGSSLTLANFRAHGRAIVTISMAVVLVALVVVGGGLMLLGYGLAMALVLGAIATATDPAATEDTIRQSGQSGGFVDTLRGIVAIDDAWGLIAFSLVVVAVGAAHGEADGAILLEAGREIGGALVLGGIIGLPAAFLTGRLSPGEPTQSEALGIVFLTAGAAIWLGVSYLLAGMVAGALVANLARHHDRAFHEIEHIKWPFMLIFFVLAGAALDIRALGVWGGLGLAYVVLRIISRWLGGVIGARLGGAPAPEAPWFGPALMPQAGVAVGMALVAGEEFPEIAAPIMAVTVATTILFELLGPLATMLAISRVGRNSAP